MFIGRSNFKLQISLTSQSWWVLLLFLSSAMRQNRRTRQTRTKRMHTISSRKRQRVGHSDRRKPTTQDGPRLAKKTSEKPKNLKEKSDAESTDFVMGYMETRLRKSSAVLGFSLSAGRCGRRADACGSKSTAIGFDYASRFRR